MLALALWGAELGLRRMDLWFPPRALRVPWRAASDDALLRAGTHPCRLDPLVLWTPREGARLAPGSDVRANELGGLGELPPRARTPRVPRIAWLGDGQAAGVGLAANELVGARLAELLRQRASADAAAVGGARELEFVAAAIDETTLVQGRLLYDARVRAWSPDIVIACYPGRVECSLAHGASDADKLAALAEWTHGERTLGFELRLAHLARLAGAALDGEWIETRERGFADAQRELALASGYGTFAWKGARRVPLDAYRSAYEQLALDVQRDGALCVIVSLPVAPRANPPLPVVEGYARAAFEAAKASGAVFVDVRAALVAADAATPSVATPGVATPGAAAATDAWSADGTRLTRAGLARVAAALAPVLEPLLAKIAAERGA